MKEHYLLSYVKMKIIHFQIFDFFEDSIDSLGQGNETYRILKRANRVLQSIDEEIEISIIKSIAIIHMINNFTVIKPNKNVIRSLYSVEGEETLQKLIKENKNN